jgi:flagella basal body P-ring formation protein FlgA
VKLMLRSQRRTLGFDDSDMEFAGAKVTQVSVASQEITPQDLIDRVRPWIDQRIGVMARAERMGLDYMSTPSRVLIPAGEWDAAPAPTWVPRGVTRTLSVPVWITIDDVTVKRVTLALNLHLYAMIPVANRAIHRHEALTEADVEYVEVDLTTLNGGSPIRPFAEVLGVRATREIRAGENLTDQNSETIPLIDKGDQVTILLEAPRMSITTTGEALQDGRLGDFIRIKNLMSDKVIQARVVKERLVQVDLVQPDAKRDRSVAIAR